MRLCILSLACALGLACSATDPEPVPALDRASVLWRALDVQLRLDALRPMLESLGGRSFSPEAVDRLSLLLSLVQRQEPGAGQVSVDLAGVGYDLLRVDAEATVRGIAGVVRSSCNDGLERIWGAVEESERDPEWPKTHSGAASATLRAAVHLRDRAMGAAPAANMLKVGIHAASIPSTALSLAMLVRTGVPTLMRIANWMRTAGLEVGILRAAAPGAGSIGGLQVVASGGALTLSVAEARALAQAGVVSAAALTLFMEATGGPKVPNPKTFAAWAARAPKRTVVANSPHAIYQVKQCGPEEVFAQASGGEKVWADGARATDAHLLDAKHVDFPERSPFIESSSMPPEVRHAIRERLVQEFRAYAAIIRDPKSPAVGLEIITNDPRAVAFFESLLSELQIPGHVVVRP